MSPSVIAAVGLLRVFLDCTGFCHEDYLREEVELAEYVRDRKDAEVHVLITEADTAAGGEEFTLSFIGLGRFAGHDRTQRVTTSAADSDDRVRRKLASALTIGLLSYLTPETLPPELEVTADLSQATPRSPLAEDPWRRWIFSLNGNIYVESEESTSERNWGVSTSADRVTEDWKLTFGVEFNESSERFDLDENGGELSVRRQDWSFNWLGVGALGAHWSAGLIGQMRSSTFENLESDLRLAPAIEWNFFPYSMYTRRQLRVLYAIGGARLDYYEETLFGRLEESRAVQQLSAAYEQREPWGTLEGRVEATNYFPGLDTHRIEVDAEVDLNLLRGLSLSIEGSASRIRDQFTLPRRNATPEEVLLRLRELRSGFEARLQLGIEYQFGSPFAAIVNPRFGQ